MSVPQRLAMLWSMATNPHARNTPENIVPAKGSGVKDWAVVLGATALLGVGGGVASFATADVPDAAEFAVSTQTNAANLVVSDPQDIVSADDEAQMQRDAERLPHPDTVQTVHYIYLSEGRDNVNDSVENFLRDNFPDEIGNDTFADGVLILGADMESRNHFVFAGGDVADQLKLRKGQRLESVLEEMKPGLRDNNLPAAVFAGANLAMDGEKAEQWGVNDAEGGRVGRTVAGAGIPAGASLLGGTIVAERRRKRRKAINQAREDHALLATEYTGLSQRLDELDVRANSVSSAFANAEMRDEWVEVRDRFLALHDVTQRNSVATDEQAYDSAKNLREAAQTFEDAGHAEDNINRLFEVERGDGPARRNLLTDIREDIVRARYEVKDETLRGDLARLQERVDALDAAPEAPDFLDRFVRLLSDYRLLLDEVKRREFSDVKEYKELERPTLTDPGYVYSGYVPYVAMSSWHHDNVQAAQDAESSSSGGGVNTGFSSGFSGAGGSSSF
ncbi:hypothetical protein CGOTT_11825 [Corynebacterium gottingense]|nr:hypothetical protein CGOTT_11825 [Corynebacterium gottingense]WJZ16567.1 hypothetical protein CGOTTB_11765 [Corynebacterium gottingense]